MGWDAHSSAEMGHINKQLVLRDKNLNERFKAEAELIKKRYGSVDEYFHLASLNHDDCRKMIEKAAARGRININVADDVGWDPTAVKKYQNLLRWDFKVSPKDLWAYWSAKTFIDLCAHFNLGIRFSY